MPRYDFLPSDDVAPPWLWHYTNRPGMLGIMKSGHLRATDLWYLNDSREMRHTVDLADQILAKLVASKSTAIQEKELYKELRHGGRSLDFPQALYVFSFSERPDFLSQWRAYGRPGGSYALGFATPRLREAAEKHHCDLIRCVYDPRRQRQLIRRLIANNVTNYLTEAKGKRDLKLLFRYRFSYSWGLIFLGPYLKHPQFAEEREWRLVFQQRSNIAPPQFRDAGALLTPFVELPSSAYPDDFGIRRVLIGPSPHADLEAAAVQRCVESSALKTTFGVKEVVIDHLRVFNDRSPIPSSSTKSRRQVALRHAALRKQIDADPLSYCVVQTSRVPYRNW